MKYLFFCNTPAHVHLYKHVINRLDDRGHDVTVLARNYTCTEALLDYYDLPYQIYGDRGTTKTSLLYNLPHHYATLLHRTHEFDPDVIFGVGTYAAHSSIITDATTILVNDSEPTPLSQRLYQPFADAILSPYTFQKRLGDNHYTFHGYKETAYLHPDVYEHSTDIRDDLDLGPDDDYVILRLNAFDASHDVAKTGFTPDDRATLIDELSDHAEVFVSDEGNTTNLDAHTLDLHPAKLLDALDEATLLIADTQTMTTEAALLGTPAIRSNAFVGDDDMGNFHELEAHDLIYNYRSFDDVLDQAQTILTTPNTDAIYTDRRDDYVTDLVNLTDLLLDIATNPTDTHTHDRLTDPEPA